MVLKEENFNEILLWQRNVVERNELTVRRKDELNNMEEIPTFIRPVPVTWSA